MPRTSEIQLTPLSIDPKAISERKFSQCAVISHYSSKTEFCSRVNTIETKYLSFFSLNIVSEFGLYAFHKALAGTG